MLQDLAVVDEEACYSSHLPHNTISKIGESKGMQTYNRPNGWNVLEREFQLVNEMSNNRSFKIKAKTEDFRIRKPIGLYFSLDITNGMGFDAGEREVVRLVFG